eukprot:gb/GECH01009467.1/.p1 GENE.gb/GECH01009467.1/~~gb/GECH01009467.1/.p1  ORF type:complete len:526 (+),score=63.81 gb/GECH01009467.1/:1-1578(+)
MGTKSRYVSRYVLHKYRMIGKKGEGTFSEVLEATAVGSGGPVAIKCMKTRFKSMEQVNRLREIQALRKLNPHPNIINMHDVVFDRKSGKLAIVFELMACNLYEIIQDRSRPLPTAGVRYYMYHLLRAIDHMHRHYIFHRDIKPENILLSSSDPDIGSLTRSSIRSHPIDVKLADLGSCRGLHSKQPLTEYISTRWYRAPECLLTDGFYSYKMDIWGAGCVFFEIVALFPLFPGANELDQLHKINNILGSPSPHILSQIKTNHVHPGSSSQSPVFRQHIKFPDVSGCGLRALLPEVDADCLELMGRMLAYSPNERISAREALQHRYFAPLWNTGEHDDDTGEPSAETHREACPTTDTTDPRPLVALSPDNATVSCSPHPQHNEHEHQYQHQHQHQHEHQNEGSTHLLSPYHTREKSDRRSTQKMNKEHKTKRNTFKEAERSKREKEKLPSIGVVPSYDSRRKRNHESSAINMRKPHHAHVRHRGSAAADVSLPSVTGRKGEMPRRTRKNGGVHPSKWKRSNAVFVN